MNDNHPPPPAEIWRTLAWSGPLLLVTILLVGLARAAPAGEAVDPARLWVVDGHSLALCPAPVPAGFPGDREARSRAGCEELRLRGDGRGVDAPEIFGGCPAEREAAKAAKARLIALVRAARAAALRREGRDRYGRTLARLVLDGADAGETLLAEGLALPWSPGEAARGDRAAHWCETR